MRATCLRVHMYAITSAPARHFVICKHAYDMCAAYPGFKAPSIGASMSTSPLYTSLPNITLSLVRHPSQPLSEQRRHQSLPLSRSMHSPTSYNTADPSINVKRTVNLTLTNLDPAKCYTITKTLADSAVSDLAESVGLLMY
jgi:hypothetical protein